MKNQPSPKNGNSSPQITIPAPDGTLQPVLNRGVIAVPHCGQIILAPLDGSSTVEVSFDAPPNALTPWRDGFLAAVPTGSDAQLFTIDVQGVRAAAGPKLPHLHQVASVAESVIVTHRPAAGQPPAVTFVDGSSFQVAGALHVPDAREPEIVRCDDGTVLIVDRRCKRWWRVDPKCSRIIDEGEGAPAVACGPDVVTAGPNGTITRPGLDDPCIVNLPWFVESLTTYGRWLLAGRHRNRQLAVFDAATLEFQKEHVFGRAGAALVIDEDAREIFAYDYGLSRWIDFANWILPDVIDEPAPSSSKPTSNEAIFIGRTVAPLMGGHAVTTGDLRILVLPVKEPGQRLEIDRPTFESFIRTEVTPNGLFS